MDQDGPVWPVLDAVIREPAMSRGCLVSVTMALCRDR
jgi:hypothetical protein